jgi:UDP-glucuronate decarboxylase
MRNKIIEEDLKNIIDGPLPWDAFSGKTVLITGANGFIAAYIVETLLYLNERNGGKKPTRVICLVRNKKRALQRFSHYKNRKDIVFWVQDVCAPIRHKEKIDYIIHAASHATPSKYGIDPVGTLMPNVIGTYNLLEFARRQHLKAFLFISVGEVYSNLNTGAEKIKESYIGRVDSLAVRSCYAESKKMGETMCICWSHQYGIPVKIVRLFHTYGPGMQLGDGRVHSDFVDDVVKNKNIVIKSDGSAVRTFNYVADTVSGFFTVILKGRTNQAYNVGSDRMISIEELARTIARLSSYTFDRKLEISKDTRDQGNRYLPSANKLLCPDTAKIKSLGWRPKYTLDEGFVRTIRSFLGL